VNTSLLLAHTARQSTRVGSGWGHHAMVESGLRKGA